jgi:hypothetical protein
VTSSTHSHPVPWSHKALASLLLDAPPLPSPIFPELAKQNKILIHEVLLRQPGLDSWNPNAVDQDCKTDAYHLGRLLFLIWKNHSCKVCRILFLFVSFSVCLLNPEVAD